MNGQWRFLICMRILGCGHNNELAISIPTPAYATSLAISLVWLLESVCVVAFLSCSTTYARVAIDNLALFFILEGADFATIHPIDDPDCPRISIGRIFMS